MLSGRASKCSTAETGENRVPDPREVVAAEWREFGFRLRLHVCDGVYPVAEDCLGDIVGCGAL